MWRLWIGEWGQGAPGDPVEGKAVLLTLALGLFLCTSPVPLLQSHPL